MFDRGTQPALAQRRGRHQALADFVDEPAIEVDGPVGAGWCEDGDLFAGCMSGGGRDKPLLFGFGLELADTYRIGKPYIRALGKRWGRPWEKRAIPAITAWLRAIDPHVEEAGVKAVFEEFRSCGSTQDGLVGLAMLAGFRWAEGQHTIKPWSPE